MSIVAALKWGRMPLLSPQQLALHLRQPGFRNRPILGLDIGTTYTGVAASDRKRIRARPLCVLRSTASILDEPNERKAFSESVATLVANYRPPALVVGFPLYNGRVTGMCRRVRQVMQNVAEDVDLRLPLLLWNEQYSTAEAEAFRVSVDIPYSDRRHVVDQMAASIILQGALAEVRSHAEALGEEVEAETGRVRRRRRKLEPQDARAHDWTAAFRPSTPSEESGWASLAGVSAANSSPGNGGDSQ